MITYFLECICYDDACHLKRYACNPVRKDETATSKRISNLEFLVDKFHFKNHVDSWCKKNCNPYKSVHLSKVIMF